MVAAVVWEMPGTALTARGFVVVETDKDDKYRTHYGRAIRSPKRL